ncbi:MAG: hypothetical protein ABW189_00285 [Rickettsiales bacterium]
MTFKLLTLTVALAFAQAASAENHEGALSGGREGNEAGAYEKENALDRDIWGRKLSVSPGSTYDVDALGIEMAPGSTVMLNVRQVDKGTQTVTTPFYRNVELPK